MISFNSYRENGRRRINSDPVSTLHFHSSGDVEFMSAPAGGAANDLIDGQGGTVASRMFITNEGKGGINTNNPAYQLDVNGETNANDLKVNGNTVNLWQKTTGSNDIHFSNRNVGIGISSPSAKLEINGNLIVNGKIKGALSNLWSTAGWEVPIITDLGSAWRADQPLSNGLYTGFGMATSGWYWILSGGTGSTGTPFYPMQLALDGNQPNGIRLQVCGAVYAMRLKVETNGWCDYVFNKDYKRMNINEKEEFYIQFNHLPFMPSAGDILNEGIDFESAIKGLLIEVEETRLDLTDLSKQIIVLEKENADLKSAVNQLQSRIKSNH